MFGVGWTEMLVIGVVALVVIGPKDLPIVMQRLGRFVASIRRMGTEFQRELNKTTGLDQITDLKRSLTEPLRQTSAEIAREFNAITSTGVEPSGVIKPEDPKVESVYSAISTAAGTPPQSAPANGAAASAEGVAVPVAAPKEDVPKKPRAPRKPRSATEKPPAKAVAKANGADGGARTSKRAQTAAAAKAPAAPTRRKSAAAVSVVQDAVNIVPDAEVAAVPAEGARAPRTAKPRAKKA